MDNHQHTVLTNVIIFLYQTAVSMHKKIFKKKKKSLYKIKS